MREEPPRERRDVTVRGVRMRVVEAGRESAPPLVLLHDLLESHAAFDDVIEPLGEHFRVIAPDLVGFGESEKPSAARWGYTVDAFTESVADVVAAVGVGRAAVLGHGLGGAVALTLAARHGELVSRLVLVGPLCFPHPLPPLARIATWPVVGPILFKQLLGRGAFRAHFRDHAHGEGAAVPSSRVDRYYETFNGPSGRESAFAVVRATADTSPIVARLGRVTCPTLVVWGRDDRIEPASFAQRLVREIRGARLHVLESGHSPHAEQPEEFIRVVREFLEGRR